MWEWFQNPVVWVVGGVVVFAVVLGFIRYKMTDKL